MFLDTSKKKWIIRDLEISVIENVSMKDMKWFREKIKEAAEREQAGDLTQAEALQTDEEWWEKTCEIGLGVSVDDVLESGITEPEFRELMAEVYTFLAIYGTIERAKQSALYEVETRKKEGKLTKTTQNSKN